MSFDKACSLSLILKIKILSFLPINVVTTIATDNTKQFSDYEVLYAYQINNSVKQ